ncbi:MAG: glycosyltransferase family 2 protein [Clostridia bacterium]|nr:glycosyltransferase family 2 protein [Clostridia bacterium]
MPETLLSVVAPAYNEIEVLPHFIEKTAGVLEKAGMNYELILVDDGSTDGTDKTIKRASEKNPKIKGVVFSRNFGQLAAIYCGFSKAKGDAVVVMDCDLQDDPEIIPSLVAKWQEGFDVVNAVRSARKGETAFKKGSSDLFTKVARKVTGLPVKNNSGEFKLYSAKVVKALLAMPERNKYLRTQIPWLGFKEADVYFERGAREAGTTKYNLKKLFALAEKAILPNTHLPLKIGWIIALLTGFCSIAAFITFIILSISGVGLPVSSWLFPTIGLSLSVLLLNNAARDKYVSYIYDEIKDRPMFVVKEEFGEKDSDG